MGDTADCSLIDGYADAHEHLGQNLVIELYDSSTMRLVSHFCVFAIKVSNPPIVSSSTKSFL